MNSMNGLFDNFSASLKNVLPMSPFQDAIAAFADLPYLGYINYFFPIGDCMKIFAAWLVAVGLFYAYSIIMRWLKMIGD